MTHFLFSKRGKPVTPIQQTIKGGGQHSGKGGSGCALEVGTKYKAHNSSVQSSATLNWNPTESCPSYQAHTWLITCP